MNALILGGTSFFGRDIVRTFHDAGFKVTIFSRGNEKPADLAPHDHFKGDRKSAADLKAVSETKPWDVVIDNIGYDASDAKLAVSAFRETGRYIFCSTVSVYRFVKLSFPQPLDESYVDFSYNPPNEDRNDIHWKYARGKMEAERVINQECNAPWTILRPPVVYGPNDVSHRGFWYLARLLDGGPILLPNGGINSFRISYSHDIARSFLEAACSKVAANQTYNVAQSEVITLKDFISESAKALAVEPSFVSVPLDFLGDFGGPYGNMFNLVPDLTKVTRDLKHKPTPFTDFCRYTAEWFRVEFKGDPKKLLATRSEELALAEKWRSATQTFLKRKNS